MLNSMHVIAEDGGGKNWPYLSIFLYHMEILELLSLLSSTFLSLILHISQKTLLAAL